MSFENVDLPASAPARSSRRRLLLAGIVALLLLVPLVRLIWVAAQTQTGWETISRQWRDATVGLVAGKYQPLVQREPAEQATFWLRETERIVAAEPRNPELALGAALLLDSPAMDFQKRHVRFAGSLKEEWDGEAVARGLKEFEQQCHAKCLAMAAKATELQPGEPRWWRLRALLLFNGSERRTGVPDSDLLDLLRQCQAHDPGNALYDYLAAWQRWRSVDMSALSEPDTQAKVALGMKHFLLGQQKPFCAGGDGEGPLVLAVLRRTTVPRIEYAGVAAGHSTSSRLAYAARRLWEITYYQAERLEAKGDLVGSLELRRQILRVSEQLPRLEGEIVGVSSGTLSYSARTSLRTFLARHGRLASADEVAQIDKEAEKATGDETRFWVARQLLSVRREPANKRFCFASNVAASAGVSVAPLLLLLGTAACVAARRLWQNGRRDAARLGVVPHFIAWLAACGLSFLVFGLAPAQIVSSIAMSWIVALVIDLGYLAAGGWLFWKLVIRRKLQFTLRTLLTLTVIWAILLGVSKAIGILPRKLGDFQIHGLIVPPRGEQGGETWWFQHSVATEYGRWNAAFQQWLFYSGPWICAGVALAILAAWHYLRLRRVHAATPIPRRDRWAGLLACLGRSMLAVGFLWMLAYLWFTLAVVRTAENTYQTRIADLQNPQGTMDELNKTMEEIRTWQSWRNERYPDSKRLLDRLQNTSPRSR